MNYCVTKLVFTRMFVLKIKSFYGLKPEINDNKTKINDRHDIKSDDIVKKVCGLQSSLQKMWAG